MQNPNDEKRKIMDKILWENELLRRYYSHARELIQWVELNNNFQNHSKAKLYKMLNKLGNDCYILEA